MSVVVVVVVVVVLSSSMAVRSVKRRIVEEIHKPARVHFKRRKYTLKGMHDLFQADLSEFIPFAAENNQHKYVLFVINAFTKMAYGEALKNKSGPEVLSAMKRILARCGPIKLLHTDQGLEFTNRGFTSLMQEHGINHYWTFTTVKAAFVERFQRTFKSMLYKEFSVQGNHKWLDVLQDLIQKYNNTVHSTIKMKPVQVNKRAERRLLRTVYAHNLRNKRPPTFRVGDAVRISTKRLAFDKGYLPHWSTEIFTVRKVQQTVPHTYLLQDLNGAPISGSFYREQMQKTQFVNDYLVERVVRKRGDRLFVKWLGFPPEHNSWINAADVTN